MMVLQIIKGFFLHAGNQEYRGRYYIVYITSITLMVYGTHGIKMVLWY